MDTAVADSKTPQTTKPTYEEECCMKWVTATVNKEDELPTPINTKKLSNNPSGSPKATSPTTAARISPESSNDNESKYERNLDKKATTARMSKEVPALDEDNNEDAAGLWGHHGPASPDFEPTRPTSIQLAALAALNSRARQAGRGSTDTTEEKITGDDLGNFRLTPECSPRAHVDVAEPEKYANQKHDVRMKRNDASNKLLVMRAATGGLSGIQNPTGIGYTDVQTELHKHAVKKLENLDLDVETPVLGGTDDDNRQLNASAPSFTPGSGLGEEGAFVPPGRRHDSRHHSGPPQHYQRGFSRGGGYGYRGGYRSGRYHGNHYNDRRRGGGYHGRDYDNRRDYGDYRPRNHYHRGLPRGIRRSHSNRHWGGDRSRTFSNQSYDARERDPNVPPMVFSPQAGASPRSSSPSSLVCRHWENGYCKLGERCRFLHPADSFGRRAQKHAEHLYIKDTQNANICVDWKHGRCTRGDRCQYIHPARAKGMMNMTKQQYCERYVRASQSWFDKYKVNNKEETEAAETTINPAQAQVGPVANDTTPAPQDISAASC